MPKRTASAPVVPASPSNDAPEPPPSNVNLLTYGYGGNEVWPLPTDARVGFTLGNGKVIEVSINKCGELELNSPNGFLWYQGQAANSLYVRAESIHERLT